ncbi:MFS transporter [Lentzea cavernae]|uniref:MFS transporter n=1 Tax=Lentzea cavernae TaxID=2020703 RepID=UPI00227D80CA|nr:MFS transporter [Lentzea cavernae]
MTTYVVPPRSLREAWIALAGLSAVFLFEMLDNSILNVALPTIGRDLHASTTALQWVSNSYAVVFGGLMLVFGAVADRFGRRRVMLAGLALLAVASLATPFVTSVSGLIAVRSLMGVAAAMTTPGSIALAFRLFRTDDLRVRAMTLISTVGLVGLAIGPPLGGFLLAVAPWQALLLINVPIAVLAFAGIGRGVQRDTDLHRGPADYLGGVLGTATIVLALVVPSLFAEGSWLAWVVAVLTVVAAVLYVVRARTASHPLLDLRLVAHPLVSSGLAYKAATGLAAAGLTYLVTLQLQLDWGWSPALAAAGMLPQVAVLIAAGPVVNRFVGWAGLDRGVLVGALAVVAGLAVYALFGRLGYVPVAVSLVLVAVGIRVVGAVAGVNVLKGLPENRTSIGAALVDTASQVTSAAGVAVSGTVLAVLFAGGIAQPGWSATQTAQFEQAVTVGGLALTAMAAALVGWAYFRARRAH